MKFLLLIFTILVLATIGFGIFFKKRKCECKKSTMKKIVAFNLICVAVLFLFALVPSVSMAFEAQDAAQAAQQTPSNGLGYIAAGLSTGLACIGAGIAVGQAGSAAVGAISEDSSILGRTLIILGLADGVAIYGLVISIMILIGM